MYSSMFCGLILILATVASAAEDPRLGSFHKGLADYVKIRQDERAKLTAIPKKATPQEIDTFQVSLSTAIRSARAGAKQGDVFTVEAQPAILEILKKQLSGSTHKEARAIARQGNPGTEKESATEVMPTIAVNATYPRSSSKSSVPATLLQALPSVPENIEYRFVGQTLVLLDSMSNIIIDYMKGAAPGL